ncbi:S8 family serine peptidase [Actinopolymorpha sp. NPDC004070]|uniref:S8 family serine peptidase n=1 Tax=Actinopolymorpha sp. NPDC004070 TaxID=3154548 RepID=UPI0033AF5084
MSVSKTRLRSLAVGGLVAGMVVAIGPAGWAGTPGSSGHEGDRPANQRTAVAGSADGHGEGGASSRRSRPVSVTLVTGDRVLLPKGDATAASVLPGKGRKKITFLTRRTGGHLYVIPSDALGALGSGRLDRRLFDVTGLMESRYDDAHRGTVPLIVTYADSSARSAAGARLSAVGARQVRTLPAVGGAALTVDKKQAGQFWVGLTTPGARRLGPGIAKVWLDGLHHPALDQSVPQIGAPAAWKAGYTGKGVTVGVLDTGIDATHPDLAGQVRLAHNFTEGPAGDQVGHGTHVASIIAGTAKASNGKYKGVAFDAKLLDGKVCVDEGCEESAILDGMQWAAAQKATAVNISIGGSDTPGDDPLEEAVGTLTRQTGTLFVIAAGNSGPEDHTIESPGSAEAALTVGAVDKQDNLADFSSRGPRVGDGGIKPDITAPGVDIVAARAAGTELGDPVGDKYVRLSGTSMATPHVAGAAALLAQQHPTWKASRLKPVLTSSAKANPDLSVYEQGAGRVDVAKAITQTVLGTPVGVSFGTARWPHSDDTPVTRQVTYRNTATKAVTLAVKVQLNRPDGRPAPASAMRVSAPTVTVPAGGSASVSVTSDTRHNGPDGAYSGRLVATGPGGVSLGTPLGVEKEVESYDLTIRHRDRQGKATTEAFDTLVGLDNYTFLTPEAGADGNTKLRLPKGTYVLEADITDFESSDPTIVELVQPTVALTRNTTIDADARIGRSVSTTVHRSSVRPALVDVSYDRTGSVSGLGSSVWTESFEGLYTGQLGPKAPVSGMLSHIGSQWAVPGKDDSFADSPYFYGLLNAVRGRFFTGFQRNDVKDSQLSKVVSRFARQQPGRQAVRSVFGAADPSASMSSAGLVLDLPNQVTSYLDAGPTTWSTEFTEFAVDEDGWPEDQTVLGAPDRSYRAGEAYQEKWNSAVFGPTLPAEPGYPSVGRYADELVVSVPSYSDAAGHPGDSLVDTARTRLYRDGHKIAESAYAGFLDDAVAVPRARAAYRLEVTATRPTYSRLSTKITATWTFSSGHAGDEEHGVALPLSAIRFAPRVDQWNQDHQHRVSLVPVTVTPQAGSKSGRTKSLTASVSWDDGRTWRKALVRHERGDHWVVVVPPAQHRTGYVSLRGKAVDTSGNTAELTVHHAYAIGQ